jgi:hypothetical protein
MILPGTGKGTMDSMVEGQATAIRKPGLRGSAARPSTTLWVVPLPLQGRI